MKTLTWALPVVLLGAWVSAAGCDDNRPVVDLPVGGDQAAAGGPGAGGEPVAMGGSGTSGGPGGAGEGGGGGVAGAPECPADLFTAEGESCSGFAEGFECSDGGTDPCQFGNSIVCTDDVWERREAFPAPCGGAGGGGAGGLGGAEATAGAGGSG